MAIQARNLTAIANKGAYIDNASFLFLKCASCGAFYLYNEETMQLYFDSDMLDGCLAMIQHEDDICRLCGSLNTLVETSSDDYEALSKSEWSFAL